MLADGLARWESAATIDVMEPALRRALNDLAAALEPTVDVAFSSDYAEHVRQAQADVLRP